MYSVICTNFPKSQGKQYLAWQQNVLHVQVSLRRPLCGLLILKAYKLERKSIYFCSYN